MKSKNNSLDCICYLLGFEEEKGVVYVCIAMNPTLTKVNLSWDVAWTCLSHALSTEHQEIMGLLIGTINNTEVTIHRSLVLIRKDKKKDRVEVGYNLLASSSTVAEQLAAIDNRAETVVGWYHSHPHITSMPSHVDVRTQGHYQQMDSGFLGLIFSVFDVGRLEISAFQSLGLGGKVDSCEWSRVEIPIIMYRNIDPSSQRCIEGLITLQTALLNEDLETYASFARDATPLQLARYNHLYQTSLLQLLDKQLLPTLASLHSKINSLQYEKDQLLNQISTPSPPPTLAPVTAQDIVESLFPHWKQQIECLRIVFKGFDAKIGSSSVVCRVVPSLKALSPWTFHFGLREGILLNIQRGSSPLELVIWIQEKEGMSEKLSLVFASSQGEMCELLQVHLASALRLHWNDNTP